MNEHITIIGSTYFNRSATRLEHIVRYTDNYTILICDNSYLNRSLSDIWNDGMKRATTRYVVNVDSDVLVGPHWIHHMLEAFREDKKIALVGPRASGHSLPNQLVGLEDERTLAAQVHNTGMKIVQEGKGKLVDGPVQGACWMADREKILSFGGFDLRLPFYGNDKDLYLSILKNGMRSVVSQSAYVHHIGMVDTHKGEGAKDFNVDSLMKERLYYFQRKWGFSDFTDEVYKGADPFS
jgi:GT2 family glycosyltransferase